MYMDNDMITARCQEIHFERRDITHELSKCKSQDESIPYLAALKELEDEYLSLVEQFKKQ